MNYVQATRYLQTVLGEHEKLVLENIRTIVDHFPIDSSRFRIIQVGGTNGKGSTATFIASILQRAGFRVGLFTSPHIQDVRERIQRNGRMISRRDFARALSEARDAAENMLAKGLIVNLPTFFEYLFLTAMIYFHRQQVRWVVLEVGLGGRLDATTTVPSVLSVITNISWDHMNILGNSLQKIAWEKAGILRPGVPVVCGCARNSTGYRVIRREAEARKAPFLGVLESGMELNIRQGTNGYRCRYRSGTRSVDFFVPHAGRHQCINAAIAIRAAWELQRRRVPILDSHIIDGIRKMRIPARIEIVSPPAGIPLVILDGGHNPEGIRKLGDYLKEKEISGITLIFGVLQDKRYGVMARSIAPFAERVILTLPHTPRALPPEKLLPYFHGKEVYVEPDFSRAWSIAKKFQRGIIITGSLYLAGDMRSLVLRRKGRG